MRVIVTKFTGRARAAGAACQQAQSQVHTAAGHLYDAECAWHDACQTHVDAWILAASEKLHDAIAAHLTAVAASASASTTAPSL